MRMVRSFFLFFFFTLSLNKGINAQNIDSLVNVTIETANAYSSKGEYTDAIEFLEKSLATFSQQIDRFDFSLVKLYHKLGVNYYYFGNYLKAKENSTVALNMRLEKLGPVHVDVARGYFSRGAINNQLRLLSLAEKDIGNAIHSMEELLATGQSNDSTYLLRMYDEYISLNANLKNNDLAIRYWDKSYRYYSQDERRFQKEMAALYFTKSDIYFNQKKYLLAEKNIALAIGVFKKLYAQNDNFILYLFSSYHSLARCQLEIGKLEEARKTCLLSIDLIKKQTKFNENPTVNISLGNAYNLMLELNGLLRNYDQCENNFNQSYAYNIKGLGTIYHSRIAELFNDKAQINIQQNQYKEALDLNQKSLQALLPTYKTDDPLQVINLNQHPVKDKILFLETIKQKASILTTIYNENQDSKYLQAAYNNYQTLDTVITQIRQSYAQGSQFELIEQSYPVYENSIRTALLLYEQTKENQYLEAAYHFAAKNKALVLLSGIQEEQAKSFSAIPKAFLEQEKNLKQSIFQLESELYDLGEAGSRQLKDSLFTLRRDYQKLIDRFENEYEDYYESKYGFDKSISVSSLQQQLQPSACVLEYFVGEQQIFVFIISKTTLDYVILDKPADFEEKTTGLRRQMESQAGLTNDFIDQSFQLYQYLLEDALVKGSKDNTIHHLIIIPDGNLMQLPFDVLVQDDGKDVPNYLIRDYSISYAYSNRLLFSQPKQNRADHVFAGFGLEYDDYTLAGLDAYIKNPLAILPLSRALGKLQYSDDEIREIATLLEGDYWLNKEATRQSFLENADQYAILHLATHGILNEEYPMNSALVFTRQNETTEYFLRAADLYNMQLNADMVVLSACNTGAGILQKGEGVRSLARAFSYAGCPSMVASLWNASDKSTKEILVDFYKNLKEGMTKDEAMRLAKLSYLNNAPPAYRLPYYWSHLSVIGDSNTLAVLAKPFWKKYWTWGALSLILMGAGLAFYKGRLF